MAPNKLTTMKYLGMAKVVSTTNSRFTEPIRVTADNFNNAHQKLWDHFNEVQLDDARVVALFLIEDLWLDVQIGRIKHILKTHNPYK